MSELPRAWESPGDWFAEAVPAGRRPHDLVRGCIDYVEQARAHPPRLRRSPGIVRVVDEVLPWGEANLPLLDEPGLVALHDVLERLKPFAGSRLDELDARVRARVDLMKLRRQKPDERLVALCEAAVAVTDEEDRELLHDRFHPIPGKLAAGLLDLETRHPDLAELAVPPFDKAVQAYAEKRAGRVQLVRRATFAAFSFGTVALFVARCT